MKTGKEVFERALRLLGYTNSKGELDNVKDAAIFKRGSTAVIQIYEDLRRIDRLGDKTSALKGMADELRLSPETIDDIMPYGVAMLLAQNEGDGDAQALFATLYSRKRLSIPRDTLVKRDMIPRGGF